MRKLLGLGAAAAIVLSVVVPTPTAATGAITEILTPTVAYTSGTCLFDLSGVANGTAVPALSQCNNTVTFSPTPTKFQVPGGGWASWGSPPDTEGNAPAVLNPSAVTSMTITLATPVLTAGFEAEPNPFAVHTITATFRDSANASIGTASRPIDGSAGARLLAGTSTGGPIKSIVVSSTANFAIARLRLGQPTDTCPNNATIVGTAGNDTINGTSGVDIICGGEGNDTINGYSSNDTIIGGPGNDTINGGSGHDTLISREGFDNIDGGSGNDRIEVDDVAGADTANGNGGTDTCLTDGGDTRTACEA